MTEITGLCDLACKCVAPGEEPVTFTTPGQEPVTLTSTSQEPVTLTTTGQEPVTLTTEGCSQTVECASSNGRCVGDAEILPDGMNESPGKCQDGCKCVSPGEEPVTFSTPGQEPVTLTPLGQEPVTLTSPGQEPVTLTTQGCAQTEICASLNGICVGELEIVPEWLTESVEICYEGCKCVSPGQDPVTFTLPPDGQEPVTMTTPGQEPVTLTTAGCTQTAMCASSNGLCVGEHEAIPEWLAENPGYCTGGCKCVSPGQEPVTFSVDGQEPVTLFSTGQESHNTTETTFGIPLA